ncbi:hypothetical protein [Novosphingobium sp. ZW T3_23]|uniref:hypothetical protein n=1 Tax=Novosphingobium sp. ZW T3_23 TaxID=3378084 RepID=UPI003851F702
MSRADTTRCQRAIANTPEAPACLPTFNLDRSINAARADMGEARWAQLNREWEDSPFAYGLLAGMDEGCA